MGTNRDRTKMDTLLLLLIIASLGLCAVSSHVRRRYFFYYDNNKNMADALEYCREKHTDLAIIDSMENVNALNEMADFWRMWALFFPARAWIGLYDDVDSWSWSLSDPDFYGLGEAAFRRFENDKPHNDRLCIAMGRNGKWNDQKCTKTFKPVCGNVTGRNVTFSFIKSPMTWTEAQSYCREHYTDLASVRNMEENEEIQQLIPIFHDVWIGLSRESWKWTDGSNVTFTNWKWGEPNEFFSEESCVAASYADNGKWEDWPCKDTKSFTCYTLGITKQVFRLSMQNKNSYLDLNDMAAMDDILEQIKQKLRDEGLNENIQLSWRQQPDGNVFKKEEMKEKEDEPPR